MPHHSHPPTPPVPERPVPAAVLTVSDRCAAGQREDRSGPLAVERLRAAGYDVGPARVVPDGADSVTAAIRDALAAGARFVVTSGGTGVGPRDRTPEGTRALLRQELPGIAEALRRDGERATRGAALSRAVAGIAGPPPGALVVNLPGSPGAVEEGLATLLPVAAHALAQLDGADHSAGEHAPASDAAARRPDGAAEGQARAGGHGERQKMAAMNAWLDDVCRELGVDREVMTRTTGPLLALIRDVAHGPSRPGAPLTAFLVGLSAASTPPADETEVEARVRAVEERVAAVARLVRGEAG